MTTVSGLGSSTTVLPNNSLLTTPKSSTSANAVNQSAGSAAAQSASGGTSTPSSDDVATAKAAAANSASYTFAQVAENARTVLDAGEEQYGKTPSVYTTGDQWDQIFGGMDRRSLYAVASNAGGQFTSLEQQAAGFMMEKQLADVLNPPGVSTSGSSEQDELNAESNYIKFLGNVSPEEKTSALWAVNMASAKTVYNNYASDLGQPQQTAAGTNPLVQVLMEAMKSAQYNPSRDMTVGEENDLAGIKSQPWAQGYESQIDAAYQSVLLQAKGVDIQA